jgi:hypothetical protein
MNKNKGEENAPAQLTSFALSPPPSTLVPPLLAIFILLGPLGPCLHQKPQGRKERETRRERGAMKEDGREEGGRDVRARLMC